MKQLFTTETLLGRASIHVDEDALRQVPYLYLHSIFTPAKGKRPSSIFAMTVSDYKNLSGSVSVIPDEAVSKLVGYSQPLINAAAKSNNNTIRESFVMIDAMVAEYDATKENASGPVERDIEKSLTSLLARMFLVSAGKTGEIPSTLEVSAYLGKAREEAMNIATELGQDNLGQFRLKKAKVKTETVVVEDTNTVEELDLESEIAQ